MTPSSGIFDLTGRGVSVEVRARDIFQNTNNAGDRPRKAVGREHGGEIGHHFTKPQSDCTDPEHYFTEPEPDFTEPKHYFTEPQPDFTEPEHYFTDCTPGTVQAIRFACVLMLVTIDYLSRIQIRTCSLF